MPRTITYLSNSNLLKRIPVRLPHAMMGEVDRIVKEHPQLNYNRQQFIETAVRDKIMQFLMLEKTDDDDFRPKHFSMK